MKTKEEIEKKISDLENRRREILKEYILQVKNSNFFFRDREKEDRLLANFNYIMMAETSLRWAIGQIDNLYIEI